MSYSYGVYFIGIVKLPTGEYAWHVNRFFTVIKRGVESREDWAVTASHAALLECLLSEQNFVQTALDELGYKDTKPTR